MAKQLTAVSLFSGCGGFDWGAKQAGVKIIWANDISQLAAEAYRKLFPEVEFTEGDIRTIMEFPAADILIGCYPCTGFSLGSRRRWRERRRNLFEADGNFLYREFLRALRQVQPKYVFVENVKGMLSANSGWFLKRQLSGLRRHGYKVTSALLNAADYGVPQTRKRVFIVGVRDDLEFEYVIPFPTCGKKAKRPWVSLAEAIPDTEGWPRGDFFDYPFHGHYLTRNRKRPWDQPSFTIVADHHQVPLHPMGKPMRFLKKDSWILQGTENRRLSWRECAVLQCLPKRIKLSGSLPAKYKIVGNAVPPPLAKALLEPVVNHEAGLRCDGRRGS